MRDKTKGWVGVIGIAGVLLGQILNRVLTSYFGSGASTILLAIIISILLCGILIFIVMSQYILAIGTFIVTIPIVLAGIGLYLDNFDLVGFSILLNLITWFILAKVIPRFKRDR